MRTKLSGLQVGFAALLLAACGSNPGTTPASPPPDLPATATASFVLDEAPT